MKNTGRRILIFGGSFDPPHKGHIKLLKAAVEEIRPDIVVIVPAYLSPFKDRAVTGFPDRAEMVRRSVPFLGRRGAPRLVIENFEFLRRRKTYTWQTLRYLRGKYPGAEQYFLMGTDCVAEFHKWKRPDEIARHCVLVAGRRDGAPLTSNAARYRFRLLDGVFPRVASHEARLHIIVTGEVPDSVPEGAAAYIKARKIYYLNAHEWLSGKLSPKRYEHSKKVALLAYRMALACGTDPRKAIVAGLLHDAGKQRDNSYLVDYVRSKKLKVRHFGEISEHQPNLLHAPVGAHIARTVFGVTDGAMLASIENHTLGRPGMTLLEKIIYVADFASEDRSFPEAGVVRSMALKDVERALFLAVKLKVGYIFRAGKWLCPSGIDLWNEMVLKNPSR